MPAAGQGVGKLRAAGFGRAYHGGLPQNAGGPGHPHHTVADGTKDALSARNLCEVRRILPDNRPGGGVYRVVGVVQGRPLPIVCQRGGIGGQLQGRYGGIPLPDGGHQRKARLIVFIG